VWRVLRDDGTLWLNLGDSYNAGTTAFRRPSKGTDVGRHSDASDIGNRRTNATNLKPKNLIGIPWRVALALQSDGWILRSDIIWHKTNAMPESVTDRPTRSHEYLFLLTKSERYFYDALAIAQPLDRPDEAKRKTPAKFGGANKCEEGKKQSRLHSGNEYLGTPTGTRNRRSVWSVSVASEKASHFAVFPPKLIEPCILAGTSERGQCSVCSSPWVRNRQPLRSGWQASCGCNAPAEPQIVLDPFGGSGTTAQVARHLGRRSILCELSEEYADIARAKSRRSMYEASKRPEESNGQGSLFT
jgi:DNA modification methylase